MVDNQNKINLEAIVNNSDKGKSAFEEENDQFAGEDITVNIPYNIAQLPFPRDSRDAH
jgi:hypothetical protein